MAKFEMFWQYSKKMPEEMITRLKGVDKKDVAKEGIKIAVDRLKSSRK